MKSPVPVNQDQEPVERQFIKKSVSIKASTVPTVPSVKKSSLDFEAHKKLKIALGLENEDS